MLPHGESNCTGTTGSIPRGRGVVLPSGKTVAVAASVTDRHTRSCLVIPGPPWAVLMMKDGLQALHGSDNDDVCNIVCSRSRDDYRLSRRPDHTPSTSSRPRRSSAGTLQFHPAVSRPQLALCERDLRLSLGVLPRPNHRPLPSVTCLFASCCSNGVARPHRRCL